VENAHHISFIDVYSDTRTRTPQWWSFLDLPRRSDKHSHLPWSQLSQRHPGRVFSFSLDAAKSTEHSTVLFLPPGRTEGPHFGWHDWDLGLSFTNWLSVVLGDSKKIQKGQAETHRFQFYIFHKVKQNNWCFWLEDFRGPKASNWSWGGIPPLAHGKIRFPLEFPCILAHYRSMEKLV